jgi:hypothetical protein
VAVDAARLALGDLVLEQRFEHPVCGPALAV